MTDSVHDGIRIGNCVVCSTRLPIVLTDVPIDAFNWVCTQCGAIYHGVVDPGSLPKHRENVRLCICQVNQEDLPNPRQHLLRFAQRLIDQDQRDTKRETSRRPLALAVPVTPLDEYLHPVGGSFIMVSRDISTNGIALLHHQRMEAPFAAIVLVPPGERHRIQLLVKVIRCRKVGFFYEMGGTFVEKLEAGQKAKPAYVDHFPERRGK